jgi:hypothetical protein
MNFLRYAAIATAVVLLGASPLVAANVSIGAADIVWNPTLDGTPSGTMSIEIFNSTVGPDPDLLSGFLLDLAIQPVSGTGTLQFNSASLPAGALYLMNGNSSGLGGSVSDSSVIAFAGVPNAPFGVVVPASGKFLLDLNFKTPDNAAGVFALVAQSGLGVTGWSDTEGQDREFTNIPFDGSGPVVLGYINVVPEPSSILILAGGLAVVVGVGARRRFCRG